MIKSLKQGIYFNVTLNNVYKSIYSRNKTVSFTQHLTIENVFVRRQKGE